MNNKVTFMQSGDKRYPVWFYNGLYYCTYNRAILLMIESGIFNFVTEVPDEKWISGTDELDMMLNIMNDMQSNLDIRMEHQKRMARDLQRGIDKLQ